MGGGSGRSWVGQELASPGPWANCKVARTACWNPPAPVPCSWRGVGGGTLPEGSGEAEWRVVGSTAATCPLGSSGGPGRPFTASTGPRGAAAAASRKVVGVTASGDSKTFLEAAVSPLEGPWSCQVRLQVSLGGRGGSSRGRWAAAATPQLPHCPLELRPSPLPLTPLKPQATPGAPRCLALEGDPVAAAVSEKGSSPGSHQAMQLAYRSPPRPATPALVQWLHITKWLIASEQAWLPTPLPRATGSPSRARELSVGRGLRGRLLDWDAAGQARAMRLTLPPLRGALPGDLLFPRPLCPGPQQQREGTAQGEEAGGPVRSDAASPSPHYLLSKGLGPGIFRL